MKGFPYISLTILLFIVLLSLFGDIFYYHLPSTFDKNSILLPPSFEHPMGTDRLGRDILARVIEGGKISLLIGVGSAIISSIIGLIMGVSAGYFKGLWDKSFVFIVDIFLTFPTFFLLLTLVSYIPASSLILIIVISVTGWMGTARLIRSESYKIASQPFIKVLNIANVSNYKIFFQILFTTRNSNFLCLFYLWS